MSRCPEPLQARGGVDTPHPPATPCYLRQSFCVALDVLEYSVGQAGLEFTDTCLPLPLLVHYFSLVCFCFLRQDLTLAQGSFELREIPLP